MSARVVVDAADGAGSAIAARERICVQDMRVPALQQTLIEQKQMVQV